LRARVTIAKSRPLLTIERAACAGRTTLEQKHMRAEIQNIVEEIKQSVGLLRRHL